MEDVSNAIMELRLTAAYNGHLCLFKQMCENTVTFNYALNTASHVT